MGVLTHGAMRGAAGQEGKRGYQITLRSAILEGSGIKLHKCIAAKARSQQFSRAEISNYAEVSIF